MSAFFSILFTIFFLSKIEKNAVFAFCCDILVTEVRLRFNLVRKCRSAISELRCALEIKKIKLPICAAFLLVEKVLRFVALRF